MGISDELAGLFGLSKSVGELSTFVGTEFEVNHLTGRGSKGHIAIGTNSVDRAEYYLSKQGVKFAEKSRVTSGGRTPLLYFEQEFGGFALHLRQR